MPSADPAAALDLEHPQETFAAVTVRRLRYVAAVALCAGLYLALGGLVARPPAESAGVSLAWHHAGVLGLVVLLVVTVVGVIAASLICHPDAPYAGLWCTLLGLGALAIRGGTIREVMFQAQSKGSVGDLYHALALECLEWAVILIAADMTVRFLWKRVIRNDLWLTRSGIFPEKLDLAGSRAAGGFAANPNAPAGAGAVWIDSALALAVCGAVSYLMLAILLQTQLKGQVLVGCFISFTVGALAARLLSPHADPLAYLLAVPATAIAAYLLANSGVSIVSGQMMLDGKAVAGLFPGQAVSPAGRALPIDYIAGGVPGAILGYYSALRMHLHHLTEKARDAG